MGFGIYLKNTGGGQKQKSSLCTVKWHAMQFYFDMACVNVNKGVGLIKLGANRWGGGGGGGGGGVPAVTHISLPSFTCTYTHCK